MLSLLGVPNVGNTGKQFYRTPTVMVSHTCLRKNECYFIMMKLSTVDFELFHVRHHRKDVPLGSPVHYQQIGTFRSEVEC